MSPTQPEIEATGVELLSGQRQSKESDKAVIACNDWLRMGSGRTLTGVLEKYELLRTSTSPTQSFHTLDKWSRDFDWKTRATAFDATWEARKNAEREAVLGFGLAHQYERVRKLYKLADFLETQIFERGAAGEFYNVWMPDVKSIGGGKFAERVDIERFNAPIFEQYRKVLDDIAKEVGGRVQKTETTISISLEVINRFESIAKEAGIDPAQALEEYIQQIHALQSTVDAERGG